MENRSLFRSGTRPVKKSTHLSASPFTVAATHVSLPLMSAMRPLSSAWTSGRQISLTRPRHRTQLSSHSSSLATRVIRSVRLPRSRPRLGARAMAAMHTSRLMPLAVLESPTSSWPLEERASNRLKLPVMMVICQRPWLVQLAPLRSTPALRRPPKKTSRRRKRSASAEHRLHRFYSLK